MMKKSYFALLLCSALSLEAVTIADGTQSEYQIVLPDGSGNKTLDHYVNVGGKMLRTAIKKASGADVPLVKESQKLSGKKAIYVGNTRALGNAGLSFKDFDAWEHAITVKDGDIYIYGKDLPCAAKNYTESYSSASLKGCCVFAEKFLNTRFVAPKPRCMDEHDGIRTLPQKTLTVPDDFSYRKKVRFTVQGGNGGLLYATANNFCNIHDTQLYVHYITKAIPYDKYFKDHPEYFALINGSREDPRGKKYGHTLAQYCLTNPDVQKMEYGDALKRADAGWHVVELGHADGFIGCECPRCKAWYNSSDWAEKMWLHQRDLAEKLQKDRPGTEVCISCYGITHCLPKTFTKFPGKGVYIDVAPATKELIEGWKKFNVRGIYAWVYYMGGYRPAGYSPYDSFNTLQKEAKWLWSTPVIGLYQCYFACCYGINGPWFYAWGKFLGDPDADAQALLNDYCRFSFGEKAAPVFVKFFSLIDSRMDKYPQAAGQDFNDFSGRVHIQTASELWPKRYPDDVVAELSRLLAEGEKLCDPGNPMLKVLKTEFEYLKLSATACNAAVLQQKSNTYENRCRLADALEARNQFIKKIQFKKGKFNENAPFCYSSPSYLQDGGWMAGIFGGVFNADPAALRQKSADVNAVKVRNFADPAWAKIPVQKLQSMKADNPDLGATFQLAYTDKAILLKLKAQLGKFKQESVPRDSTKLWENRVWEIFVADGYCCRQFAFNAVPKSSFDIMIWGKTVVTSKFSPGWSHWDRVSNGIWESHVTLPFSSCGCKLVPGLRLPMQIAFNATATDHALYAWQLPPSGQFSDVNGFGTAVFGDVPEVREIDVNGKFTQKDAKGNPLNWSSKALKLQTKGNALKVSGASALAAFENSTLIFVGSNEEAIVTAEVSGKGKIVFSAQWRNSAGKWVVNKGQRVPELTARNQVVQAKFQPGYFAQKGATNFKLLIYLNPGTELTVKSLKVEIRKQGSTPSSDGKAER